MRAARIATSPEGSPAPQPTPVDAAPAQEPTVWIAAPEDLARHAAAAGSPVHAMQAHIERAYDRRPRARQARWTVDPVRLALLAYTIGFWWGVYALVSAMVHGWVR